ncbi:hypothetical protein [Ekhidna sp.]|uniref:hypothetical protein n=1 Tax=Ekhidna sp. TaxID=2608089 RepID=UPI0032ECE8F0
MKNFRFLLSILTIVSLTSLWTGCMSDDPIEEVEKNYLTGTFIDSPVQGLTYVTSDTTGKTDANGTFVYEENEIAIEFKLGGLSLGIVSINETITPLEFGGSNATIYTPIVNNIASLLQSVDSDGDASNGITIDELVSEQFNSNTLSLTSENFASDLINLINSINVELGIDLNFVHPNDAAEHLASSLNLDGQVEFRPVVKVGRRWEDGIYYAYNTVGFDDPDSEYIFNVMGDSVVYNFGNGTAYLMNMVYEGDTLFGFGNLYFYVGTDSMGTSYEYAHRNSSPGYVVDHKDTTFISYYNYLKVSGDENLIEGVYESFLVFNRKRFDQDPFKIEVISNRLEISSLDDDDSLTFTTYNRLADTTFLTKIHRNIIEDEKMFLVQMEGSSFLFAERNSGFYPGLIARKED